MKKIDINNIKSIAVVGAGIMGEGIAQGFAQAGYQVKVFDLDESILIRCQQNIRKNSNEFLSFGLCHDPVDEVLARIEFIVSDGQPSAFANVDFIVEVLPEVLSLKQQFFQQLDSLPANIIFATNTSSMTVSNIALNIQSAQRLIGLHYFNPAHIIPAVEIHTGRQTSEQTIEITRQLMLRVGKKPVLVRKEIPGFIINRLTGAMEREIDNLLDAGVVSPEDLDIAVKASFGFRLACLGPMEAEDMIGLDTAARASANIFPTLSNAAIPSQQLIDKVQQGELGIKSGKGWYDYPSASKADKVAENNLRLIRQLQLFMQNN